MNRHQHPTNNAVLGAPPGVPIDECNALPITRVVWQDTGGHGVVSYWMPTPDELRRINAGMAVRLTVLGQTHPPLALGVDGDGDSHAGLRAACGRIVGVQTPGLSPGRRAARPVESSR